MDLIDFLWNRSQDTSIRETRDKIERMQIDRDLHGWDFRSLAAENIELKVRLGLLVRLLIDKGVFTAQEYAALIAAAQSKGE